jgi:hypothetical protein
MSPGVPLEQRERTLPDAASLFGLAAVTQCDGLLMKSDRQIGIVANQRCVAE